MNLWLVHSEICVFSDCGEPVWKNKKKQSKISVEYFCIQLWVVSEIRVRLRQYKKKNKKNEYSHCHWPYMHVLGISLASYMKYIGFQFIFQWVSNTWTNFTIKWLISTMANRNGGETDLLQKKSNGTYDDPQTDELIVSECYFLFTTAFYEFYYSDYCDWLPTWR